MAHQHQEQQQPNNADRQQLQQLQLQQQQQPVRFVLPPPSPFVIPTDRRYINAQTQRVQLRVSLVGNNRFICLAEGEQGVFQTKALFMADRRLGRRGSFRIYNVSDENDPMLFRWLAEAAAATTTTKKKVWPHFETAGEVYRSVNTLGGFVEYKLVRGNSQTKIRQLVASTIYNTKSLRFPVVQGTADRIMYSVIHNNSVVDSESIINGDASSGNRTSSQIPYFSSLNKPAIRHIDDGIHQIGEDHKELTVFQSKRRFTNGKGRTLHRDVEPFAQKYQGRALVSSKKNVQIMNVSTGKTVLQVGRIDKNTFAVDFLTPYTPFQAFGVFLAQLDAN